MKLSKMITGKDIKEWGIPIPIYKKRVYRSKEWREKISKANKGHIVLESTKEKISKATKGKNNPFYGKHHSEETKRKISKTKKWRKNSLIVGKNNGNWKGGITSSNHLIRNSLNYEIWRNAILKRDKFICQKCGQYGGNLVVHHINNFADFLELRFAIDNGITLCKNCHKIFHKIFGKENNTKEQWGEYEII